MKTLRKKIFIRMLFVIIVVTLSFFTGCLQNPSTRPQYVEPLTFLQDTRNQTLIVHAVPVHYTLLWDNVTIDQGTGILPLGAIKVGDTIIECQGEVVLTIRYNSSFSMRPTYEFRTPVEEQTKLSGTWIENITDIGKIDNFRGTMMFNPDGTFTKNQTGYSSVVGTWELAYNNVLQHNYLENDLMLILHDTSTTVFTYWINELEDSRIRLDLNLDTYNTGGNNYTFLGASLYKQL